MFLHFVLVFVLSTLGGVLCRFLLVHYEHGQAEEHGDPGKAPHEMLVLVSNFLGVVLVGIMNEECADGETEKSANYEGYGEDANGYHALVVTKPYAG